MIDLHLHTTYSDGTDNVSELLENAEKNKLELISITDHNVTGAYFELENHSETREKFKGEILVGSEIKTVFEKINIEILAYGFDYKKLEIKQEDRNIVQNDILKHFIKVGREMGIKARDDISIDLTNPGRQYASWVYVEEVSKYKENEEIINSLGGFSRRFFYRDFECNLNSPFYYDTSKYYDDCNTLIKKIHDAGGLAFLAHGLLYPFENVREAIEKIISTTEIDGLECLYPLFDDEERKFMIDLCRKYNKFSSGGSDYHAKNKPEVFIGTGINNNLKIEKSFVDSWIKKLKTI